MVYPILCIAENRVDHLLSMSGILLGTLLSTVLSKALSKIQHRERFEVLKMGAPEREYLSPEEAAQYDLIKVGQIYKEIRGKKYDVISYRKAGKIHYRIPVRVYMQKIAKTVQELETKAVQLRQAYDALMRRIQNG